MLTVVLNSDGFAELLENAEFTRRIGRQDRRIIVARHRRQGGVRGRGRPPRRPRGGGRRGRRDRRAAPRRGRPGARRPREPPRRVRRRARREEHGPRRRARPPRAPGGQPRRSRGKAGRDPGQARRHRHLRHRSGADRLGRLHLAGQRARSCRASACAGAACTRASTSPSAPGTPVVASLGGTVAIAGPVSGYGNYICISHTGGLSTCYAHNTSLAVSVGQTRLPGPGHRQLRLHGPLPRPARPLRDAHQRRRRWTPWATCSPLAIACGS